MGVNKSWLKGQPFARNVPSRQIDRETMLDMLGIVHYEAVRHSALEDVGFHDEEPSVDCLFDYVLDALGVPRESDTFSRHPFGMIFYNDFWLEKKFATLDAALAAMEQEAKAVSERLANAAARRASFVAVNNGDASSEDGPK